MLPKQYRLPLKTEAKILYQKGKVFTTPFFIVFAMEDRNKKRTPRFGYIVNNKIDQRATKRNQLKRRLRASTWMYLQKNQILGDFLIIAKKACLNATTTQISQILKNLLRIFSKEKKK